MSAPPELPAVLQGLTPDQLEELQDIAERKAWVHATEVSEFTDREQELIAKAQSESSPRVARGVRDRLYQRHLWTALRWYLFGGYVDLVGFLEHPTRAYDPDTNPYLKLWVPGWARTKDEHDPASPYKTLPDKDYLRLYAYAWVHEPLIAIPKSRQMMATWLFCCIASWIVAFQPAQRVGMISKKADDADALLERVNTVLKGLPRDRFYVPGNPEKDRKYGEIHIPETDTTIMGLGENPDNVRQHTFSWIFDDEAAFQEYAEEIVRAVLAAVHGGNARLTVVSTSNGEDYFHDIVTEGGRISAPAGK